MLLLVRILKADDTRVGLMVVGGRIQSVASAMVCGNGVAASLPPGVPARTVEDDKGAGLDPHEHEFNVPYWSVTV